MNKTIIMVIFGLLAGLFFFTWYPHCGKTTTVLKPGRIDSSQVVTPIKPIFVSQGVDPTKVRDSVVRHIQDSLVKIIKPIIIHGKVIDTGYDTELVDMLDTTEDTNFHFYGVSAKDSCGDSAFAEMGSSIFPAKEPIDLQRHLKMYPRADTAKKYHQTDTQVVTKTKTKTTIAPIIGCIVFMLTTLSLLIHK